MFHTSWTTSGRGTALANSKVLPKVGWDQGGKNKWPCLSSGSLLLKQKQICCTSHFTMTKLKLIFSVPSTSPQSQISGLEMRIVFGKMPVDPLNHDFQPNCFAFVEDVFLQVECIHTRPGCSEAASSCCLDSRRKLFKVWHICDPISLVSSPAADKEDPNILKTYP